MGCGGSSKLQKHTTPRQELPVSEASTNEDIRDTYDIGAVLGSGSFGQVREAIVKGSPTREVRAVKMIERDNDNGEWSAKAMFLREVDLLQQIHHENIIRYYDFYEDMHFLYVVMELCQGGEVFGKIIELKRFSEQNAAFLGKQMLRAIDYIHKMNICHRDVKAENFMLSEPSINSVVKMIDFGMACKFEDGEALTELCGSPHYLAPELIGQMYNQLVDVWACGVLLYLLMYGHYPYDAKQPRDIMVKILSDPIRWQTKAKVSKYGLDFLKRTLKHHPEERMSADDALNHPWMTLASAPSSRETDALPREVIRSAHQRVTATRKQVDPQIEKVRNAKLKRIGEDFNRGVRHGKRLGETSRDGFMTKPEYVRRETQIATAPSRAFASEHVRLQKLLDNGTGPGIKAEQRFWDEEVLAERAAESPETGREAGRQGLRSATCTTSRRLPFDGALSCPDERKRAGLAEGGRPVEADLEAVLPGQAPPPGVRSLD